jgi:hypothetical protein
MTYLNPETGFASRASSLWLTFKAQDNFRVKEFVIEYRLSGVGQYEELARVQAASGTPAGEGTDSLLLLE